MKTKRNETPSEGFTPKGFFGILETLNFHLDDHVEKRNRTEDTFEGLTFPLQTCNPPGTHLCLRS